MDYSKLKKPGPMITKKYGMLPKNTNISTWSGMSLELYPRVKFDRETGKGYDDTRLLGTVSFGRPDKYGCFPLTVTMNESLEKADYKEIFTAITQALSGVDKPKMIQINRTGDRALEEALAELKFEEDAKDSSCLLWHTKSQNWVAMYLCLGIAMGMGFGSLIGGAWVYIGLVLGLIISGGIGYMHTKKDKKKQDDLLMARANDHSDPPPFDGDDDEDETEDEAASEEE